MGVRNFSLNWVPRTGYMFVDVMLLISGFCLFLPYARQMTDPLAPEPDNLRTFFKKRAARILPSYYLCLLLYLIFWVRPSDYANVKQYLQDIFAHLTFTQTFWPESYIGTKFPTALWTLGVEMQFYLVFPLLARVFRRFPLMCWAVLSVLAQVYIVLFAHLPQGNAESLRINQLPAFLGVYANGMLCALFFCRLRIWREREWKKNRILPLAALMLLLFSGAAIVCMLNDGLSRAAIIQRWQVDYRFLFSAMVCVFILLLDAAPKGVQWLFSNRIAAFLSAVSYNFYIWHSTALLKLKAWHIPYYPDAPEGAAAWPQSAGGEPWHFAWQVKYTVLFWACALLLAAFFTYLIEKPTAKQLLRKKKITRT